jgi:hypothetical protein
MFRKFRSEIQGIPAETPDSNLGWDRGELMAKIPPEMTKTKTPQIHLGGTHVLTAGKKERREAQGGLTRSMHTARLVELTLRP